MCQIDQAKQEPPQTRFKTSPQDFLKILNDLAIEHETFHHEAVFTVQQSQKVTGLVKGAHCRNLALYNKKKRVWLVVAQDKTAIDLKKLADTLEMGRLSFIRPERLWDCLGVTPGSVNPFCIMNDTDLKVTIVLDQSMMNQSLVNYHPMDNTMSTALTPNDLLKFIEWTGHTPVYFNPEDVQPDT